MPLASTSGRLGLGNGCHHVVVPLSHQQVHCGIRRISYIPKRQTFAKSTEGDAPEPNWDEEMTIFKKRTLKPSQMEALRKLEEEKVDVGRVLYCRDSIAIVEGLNNDADVGTSLSFSSGAKGVILWRRSDNVVFSLLLGGSDLVTVGDGVECRVRGILQVVDESEGPSTKREYEFMQVPVGDALIGQVVDYIGRPLPANGGPALSQVPVGTDKHLPLLNIQPDMESREQINEPLVTGVKALDVLTPLGRGQALQVSGPQGSGKTQLCIDAVMGQRGKDVRCVYAAVGCSGEQLERTVAQLKAHGCMEYTTVVAATADRPLGQQYAAMLTACSIAEATRDAGGHALVVLNDVSVMVRMWEMITVAMADLGPVATEEVADLQAEVTTTATAEEDAEEGATAAESSGESDEMVEYEGMLVSVAAAQRRRFFSSLIQRCAKMHRRLKGGSLSALLVIPGSPATGNVRKAREKILQYRHLSEEQKQKLLKALEKQAEAESNASSNKMPKGPVPEELRTEVVEEFMSIADGQIVLRAMRDAASGGVIVDPQLSVSRIGSRAYPPVMADLAPQVRFELAQAEDARKFAAGSANANDPAAERAQRRANAITAALPQPQRSVCPIEVQVVHLLALKKGLLDDVPASQVGKKLDALTAAVQEKCPQALEEIAETQRLTATAEAAISAVFNESSQVQQAA